MWRIASLILCRLNRWLGKDWTLGPLGCWSNPVRCHMPSGERAYLERLRTPDGRALAYQRLGSMGTPSPSGHILDLYAIGRRDSGPLGEIYMDMYCAGRVETRPIPGFSIVPPVETPALN